MVIAPGRTRWSPFYVRFAIVRVGYFLQGREPSDPPRLPSVHGDEKLANRRIGLHRRESACCRTRRTVASVREGRRAGRMPRPALGVAGELMMSYTCRG